MTQDFDALEDASNVIGLKGKLKEYAYSSKIQEPFCTSIEKLAVLMAIHQEQGESLTSYRKRLEAESSVLESEWGELYPIGLVDSNNNQG